MQFGRRVKDASLFTGFTHARGCGVSATWGTVGRRSRALRRECAIHQEPTALPATDRLVKGQTGQRRAGPLPRRGRAGLVGSAYVQQQPAPRWLR